MNNKSIENRVAQLKARKIAQSRIKPMMYVGPILFGIGTILVGAVIALLANQSGHFVGKVFPLGLIYAVAGPYGLFAAFLFFGIFMSFIGYRNLLKYRIQESENE